MGRTIYKDCIGKRFGRLLIIDVTTEKYQGRSKTGYRTLATCRCDCGTEKKQHITSILCGETQSCGCLAREKTVERFKTHGQSRKSPEYFVWIAMRQRCNCETQDQYKDYGGRGIKICESWSDYNVFITDMGRRPTNKHTLERIDVNKGYDKDNCKWATWTEQTRNKRSNRVITVGKTTMIVTDWMKYIGIVNNYHKFKKYSDRYGSDAAGISVLLTEYNKPLPEPTE